MVSLVALPEQVQAGPGSGISEISWDTGDDSEGQVFVSMDGKPETLFATGTRGSKAAHWIQSGSRYEFRLYALPDKRLLSQVTVVGVEPPPKEALRGLLDPPLNTLGFPIYEPDLQAPAVMSTENLRRSLLPEITSSGRKGTALLSICTRNRIHSARVLIASVREHHAPGEITIYVLVVDWDGQEPLDLSDAVILSGTDIGVDRFDYMALKYSASELCCACKPYLVQYVMATTSNHKLLYLDSDTYVFTRLDYLLKCLDDAPLVVVPRTLEPTPNRDRFYERPSLGDLITEGTYNAGMFGMTVVPENVHFVAQWATLVTEPGAFLSDLGLQHEKHFFNWLVGLADRIKVINEKAYCVAYWNLHDRSLRYAGWDLPDQTERAGWLVDGKPLVTFHFSGFSIEQKNRLSVDDSRYTLYFLPSVSKLIEFYSEKLIEHGALTNPRKSYRYDHFPSGLTITPAIRETFKKYETFLWRNLSPWSDPGEHFYAQRLFGPVPQTSSLLPVALFQIYERRPDLQLKFPQAHVEPDPMLEWFSLRANDEEQLLYEYFNYHRPAVPKLAAVQSILELQSKHPTLFAGLNRPLSGGRTRLIARLKNAGLETVAEKMFLASDEYFALSPMYLLWKFVQDNNHLLTLFPDLLFTDAPRFSEWLKQNGPSHFLDPDLGRIFLERAQGRSLARVFSYLNRTGELARRAPLILLGQDKERCFRILINQSQHNLEFDLDDLVMCLWILAVKPWAGLPLTLELLPNAGRQPSSLLPEGQEILLKDLSAAPECREAIAEYRSQATAWHPHDSPSQRGVNLFGFFKSPIGLGSLSRGLGLALRTVGERVQENLVGNVSMERDLRPEDFIRTYDGSLSTNVFVSYPHLITRLLTGYPDYIVKDRKNIAYLAWEQRDGYPSWDQDFAEFDQIWALSDFAAGSFRRYMKRDDVITVPPVIDFESFPQAASKQQVELDPDRFTFLYVFDANSSIERKNPKAAIRAFASAFAANDKVQLLLKISNAQRMEHRPKLRELVDLASRSRPDIRFLLGNLPYSEILRLISAVDCYVSLHRAEGFGYTCAEAMAYGKPVIATNYSATTEFMDTRSAFLVDYQECEVTEADGPFQRGSVWAEPNVEDAARHMRQVYSNREAASQIGLAGRTRVCEMLDAGRIGHLAALALFDQSQGLDFDPQTSTAHVNPVE